MKDRLLNKLRDVRENPDSKAFIIADARDPDMAMGVPSPGRIDPSAGSRGFRSMGEFHEDIRATVRQGLVDIMLTSVSTMDVLAHREGLFADSEVTPAVRANDTSDIWIGRGMRYRAEPSRPFATCHIAEAQYGSLTAPQDGKPKVNLGLYSITFNNDLAADRENYQAFKTFRTEAQRAGFRYFLEVYAPNIETGLKPQEIPSFVNDHICRTLAGVPLAGRPEFLKIPFFGPEALEELVGYDRSVVVGVLGGPGGTNHDTFKLLSEAQKHGARVALFGRKIKEAEHPLSLIQFMRRIVDGEIDAKEAVRAYHGELQKLEILPRRELSKDLELTMEVLGYCK